MAFGHIQGAVANSTSGSPLNVVLTVNPTPGNLVVVSVSIGAIFTITSIKDSANNSYQLSTNSPSLNVGGAGTLALAYLLNAPANATKTITVTWGGGAASATIWAEEFSVSGGTAAFDKDASSGVSQSGTAITVPSIVPTGNNELLYSVSTGSAALTAPAAGATAGLWTGGAGGISVGGNGGDVEYDLSASASQAVNFTQASNVSYNAMAMAFTFTASGGGATPTFDAQGFIEMDY